MTVAMISVRMCLLPELWEVTISRRDEFRPSRPREAALKLVIPKAYRSNRPNRLMRSAGAGADHESSEAGAGASWELRRDARARSDRDEPHDRLCVFLRGAQRRRHQAGRLCREGDPRGQ